MADSNWYVVHTYSGYEKKVKADIEKTIENRNLQEEILEVRVPMQDVVEIKNGFLFLKASGPVKKRETVLFILQFSHACWQ